MCYHYRQLIYKASKLSTQFKDIYAISCFLIYGGPVLDFSILSTQFGNNYTIAHSIPCGRSVYEAPKQSTKIGIVFYSRIFWDGALQTRFQLLVLKICRSSECEAEGITVGIVRLIGFDCVGRREASGPVGLVWATSNCEGVKISVLMFISLAC